MSMKLTTNMMVEDVHKTIAFYQKILGFEHVMSVPKDSEEMLFEYDAGRPICYAAIKRDEIELMFQERESFQEDVPAFKPGTPIGGTLTFYFQVDDVEALAAKIKGDCEIVRDLRDTFYGMREIYVRDPNGYILCFGQPLNPEEDA